MGNTRIQDAKLGSIMGLHPGFIPLGMKERGGVMYIVSMNKEGYGEIGSIPSPYITYSGFDDHYVAKQLDGEQEIPLTEHLQSDLEAGRPTENDEKYLNPGDPFVIYLDINEAQKPLISGYNDQGVYEKRYYQVRLYAVTGEYGEIDITDRLGLRTYRQVTGVDSSPYEKSNYWFSTKSLDSLIERLDEVKECLYYPNLPKGKLKIKIVPEHITNFNFGPCTILNTITQQFVNYPALYRNRAEGIALVTLQSFIYNSDCSWRISKLKLRAYSTTTKSEVEGGKSLKVRIANGDTKIETPSGDWTPVCTDPSDPYYKMDSDGFVTAEYVPRGTRSLSVDYGENPIIYSTYPRACNFEKFHHMVDPNDSTAFSLVSRVDSLGPTNLQLYNDPLHHDGIFVIDLEGEPNQWVHLTVEGYDTSLGEDILVGVINFTFNPALSFNSQDAEFMLRAETGIGESGYTNQFIDKSKNPNDNFELKLRGLVAPSQGGSNKLYQKYNEETRIYEEGKVAEYAVNDSKKEDPRIEVHPQFFVDGDYFYDVTTADGEIDEATTNPHRRLIMLCDKIKGDNRAYYYSNFCALKRRPNKLKLFKLITDAQKYRQYSYAPYTKEGMTWRDINHIGTETFSDPKNDLVHFCDAQARYWEGADNKDTVEVLSNQTEYKVTDRSQHVDVNVPGISSGHMTAHKNDISDGIAAGILRTDIDILSKDGGERIIDDEFYRNSKVVGNLNYDPLFHEHAPFNKPAEWDLQKREIDHPDTYYFDEGEIEAMNGVNGYPANIPFRTDRTKYPYNQLHHFDHDSAWSWYVNMGEPVNLVYNTPPMPSARDFHINLASRFNNRNLVGQVTEAIAGDLTEDKPTFDNPYVLKLNTKYTPASYKYPLKYLFDKNKNQFVLRIKNQELTNNTQLIVLTKKLRQDQGLFRASLYARQYVNGVETPLMSRPSTIETPAGNIEMYKLNESDDFTARHIIPNNTTDYLLKPSAVMDLPFNYDNATQSITWDHMGIVHLSYNDEAIKWIVGSLSAVALAVAIVFTGGAAAAMAGTGGFLVGCLTTYSTLALTSILTAGGVGALASLNSLATHDSAGFWLRLGYMLNIGLLELDSLDDFSSTWSVLNTWAQTLQESAELPKGYGKEENWTQSDRIGIFAKEDDPTCPVAFRMDNSSTSDQKYFMGLGLNALLEIDKDNSQIAYENTSTFLLQPQFNVVDNTGAPAGFRGSIMSKPDIQYDENLFRIREGADTFDNTYFYDATKMISVDPYPDASFKQEGYCAVEAISNNLPTPVVLEGHYVMNCNSMKFLDQDFAPVTTRAAGPARVSLHGGSSSSSNGNPNFNTSISGLIPGDSSLQNAGVLDTSTDNTVPVLEIVDEDGNQSLIKFRNGAMHAYFPKKVTVVSIQVPKDTHRVYYSIGMYKVVDEDCKIQLAGDYTGQEIVIDKLKHDLICVPDVYCYYEETGCMDKLYKGKWYPIYGYQHLHGRFKLSDDGYKGDLCSETGSVLEYGTVSGQQINVRK